jgi:hypothetical protein
MFFFSCSIDFQSDRTFDDLTAELSRRFLGGLRFIPADRRDAREFTRAEFAEHTVLNHDVDLIWDDWLGHFRLCVLKGENEVWFPDPQTWADWHHGSLERCLGVLLRQCRGGGASFTSTRTPPGRTWTCGGRRSRSTPA